MITLITKGNSWLLWRCPPAGRATDDGRPTRADQRRRRPGVPVQPAARSPRLGAARPPRYIGLELDDFWIIASLDIGQQVGLTTHSAADLVIAAHHALTDSRHHRTDDVLHSLINVFEWATEREGHARRASLSSTMNH